MPRAFVLMAAMPPTIGHLRLIEFANSLADTTVIVATQPSEPMVTNRFLSIYQAARELNSKIKVRHFDLEIEQNPEAPGFWDRWRSIFADYGFESGDYVVASEPYGDRLAQEIGGVFVPYDLNRSLTPVKATYIRANPQAHWDEILPEFRKRLVTRVTIFGADSCGKTTMGHDLGEFYKAPWVFEWARPYLENLDDVTITAEKMHMIWRGQMALQDSLKHIADSPVIFQDTDLFSTLGYWEMWDGGAPEGLETDAQWYKSHLYLIAPSNIPFEPDPLRYGGDQRETTDQYWIDLCEREGLNYRVLTESSRTGRVAEASKHIDSLVAKRLDLTYERQYN